MMEEQDCDQLLEWAASMGITDASLASCPAPHQAQCGLGYSLRIASFPLAGGRGLAAVRDLEEGELILRVPDTALMSGRSAREDPVLARLLNKHPKLSSVQILAVHLVREISRKSESKWFPYLVQLPRSHNSLACFSEDEAEALQVEDAVWTAKQAANQVRQSWLEAQSLLKELGLQHKFRTFKAWLWASVMISSRTLHVPWDEAGTLCPIGDLFNYAAPGAGFRAKNVSGCDLHGTSHNGDSESDGEENDGGLELKERLRDGGYEHEHRAFCFYARQFYKKGEQVLLCYGQYNNLELLEHYGFLLPDNPNDNLHMALPCATEFGNQTDTSFHLKVQPRDLYLLADGRPSYSLLSALRLRAAPYPLQKSHGHLAISGVQISAECDLCVFRWLENRCLALLAEITTASEERELLIDSDALKPSTSRSVVLERDFGRFPHLLHDVKMMARVGQTERFKLAVEWRKSYELILHRCIARCRRKIRHLRQSGIFDNTKIT